MNLRWFKIKDVVKLNIAITKMQKFNSYNFAEDPSPSLPCLRFIHICIFVNNNEGFRGCINKTDFP
jgi:hypothetical protein